MNPLLVAAESDGSRAEMGALARKCFSTAVWIAFWGFCAASGVATSPNPAIAIAIAASVGAIGVTAMICGTILAIRVHPARDPRAAFDTKPVTDSDAFDVVSRRG